MTTITVGALPSGIAIGSVNGADFAYVVNRNDNSVSVIEIASDTVVATVTVGEAPRGVAITPNGAYAYVSNGGDNPGTVSVIQTSNNTVVATVTVGLFPYGVAVTPDGLFVYVVNDDDTTVSAIQTSDNTQIATPAVGVGAYFVAVSSITAISPTSTVSGVSTKNRSAFQKEFYNQIEWTQPSEGSFNSYRIYRDAALTNLAGTTKGRIFIDHNREKGQTYSYYIVAVDSETAYLVGNVSVTVK